MCKLSNSVFSKKLLPFTYDRIILMVLFAIQPGRCYLQWVTVISYIEGIKEKSTLRDPTTNNSLDHPFLLVSMLSKSLKFFRRCTKLRETFKAPLLNLTFFINESEWRKQFNVLYVREARWHLKCLTFSKSFTNDNIINLARRLSPYLIIVCSTFNEFASSFAFLKNRSRSRRAIFAFAPFDDNYENLQTSFFTFFSLAKVRPMRTILTYRQTYTHTHTETDEPMAIGEILYKCLKPGLLSIANAWIYVNDFVQKFDSPATVVFGKLQHRYKARYTHSYTSILIKINMMVETDRNKKGSVYADLQNAAWVRFRNFRNRINKVFTGAL